MDVIAPEGNSTGSTEPTPKDLLEKIERNATLACSSRPLILGGNMGRQPVTYTAEPCFPCYKSVYFHHKLTQLFLYCFLHKITMLLTKIFHV